MQILSIKLVDSPFATKYRCVVYKGPQAFILVCI